MGILPEPCERSKGLAVRIREAPWPCLARVIVGLVLAGCRAGTEPSDGLRWEVGERCEVVRGTPNLSRSGARFGWCLCESDDLDGDGKTDLIVSAPRLDVRREYDHLGAVIAVSS